MTRRTVGLIAIVLVASTAPASLAQGADASGYAGSSLSFEAGENGLLDYAVGGETVAESIRVQSQAEADAALSLGVGADLGSVVDVPGAAISVDSSTETGASVHSESGATLRAHDNGHGSLVVTGDGDAQYVEFGLSEGASAEAESESRVVVTDESGVEGTVLVVGDGSVEVNDAGNVTAAVEGDGRLVFRSYPDGRSEGDRQNEDLVQRGSAAASVYLTGDGSDAVVYDDETTVEVTQRAEGRVSMAVDRTSEEGRVVITSVADGTFESTDDVQVSVDGEAAVRASSSAEVAAAAAGGEAPKYMVRQRSDASASAEVLVGVTHFSTRNVEMSDGGSEAGSGDGSGAGDGDEPGAGDGPDDVESGDGADGGDSTGASSPGFGVIGAVAALGAAVVLLGRTRL